MSCIRLLSSSYCLWKRSLTGNWVAVSGLVTGPGYPMVWYRVVLILGYTDRPTITRLRTESADDVLFMSSSCGLHAVFDMLCAKHGYEYASRHVGCIGGDPGRQDCTTPDHGIQSLGLPTISSN